MDADEIQVGEWWRSRKSGRRVSIVSLNRTAEVVTYNDGYGGYTKDYADFRDLFEREATNKEIGDLHA